MTELMNPNDVGIDMNDVSITPRSVCRQMVRLETEGQIEPTVLTENDTVCRCDLCWPYASAQLLAARRLGWETIMVTYEH